MVFLVNTMGYYVLFRLRQMQIQHEMVEGIRHGLYHPSITRLEILHPERDRDFIRHGNREFTYQGKMYDIVVERRGGDTTFFYCLRDKKEENLLASLAVCLHQRNNRHRNDSFPLLIYHLITQALPADQPDASKDPGIQYQFGDRQENLHSPFLVRFAPPPEKS